MIDIAGMILNAIALATTFGCGLYCGYKKDNAKIYVVFLHIAIASVLSFMAMA